MLKLGATLLLSAWALSSAAAADVSVQDAEIFFADYQAKSSASDPAEADLYCDGGKVTMIREDAKGETQVLVGAATEFKRIIRESAAESKALGDYSEFSQASYRAERGMVRIDATRTSALRKYQSPAVFHVGKCDSGELGIVEVVFHSKAAG